MSKIMSVRLTDRLRELAKKYSHSGAIGDGIRHLMERGAAVVEVETETGIFQHIKAELSQLQAQGTESAMIWVASRLASGESIFSDAEILYLAQIIQEQAHAHRWLLSPESYLEAHDVLYALAKASDGLVDNGVAMCLGRNLSINCDSMADFVAKLASKPGVDSRITPDALYRCICTLIETLVPTNCLRPNILTAQQVVMLARHACQAYFSANPLAVAPPALAKKITPYTREIHIGIFHLLLMQTNDAFCCFLSSEKDENGLVLPIGYQGFRRLCAASSSLKTGDVHVINVGHGGRLNVSSDVAEQLEVECKAILVDPSLNTNNLIMSLISGKDWPCVAPC